MKKSINPTRDSFKTRDSNLVDWFNAQEIVRSQFLPQRDSRIEAFTNSIWPVANSYYSPLNPVFLSQLSYTELLNRNSVWLARDGLVPALWFFKTRPTPDGFKGRIFFHQSIVPFIPTAWKKNVGIYKISNHPEFVPKLEKSVRLIIAGLAMDTFASLKYLDDFFATLSTRHAGQLAKTTEILAFLPSRYDGFSNHYREEYYAEFFLRIVKTFGVKITPVTWSQLESYSSFNGYQMVDINEHLLCSDNFLLHSCLNRGATLLKPSPSKFNFEEFVPLSPCHGMWISRSLPLNARIGGAKNILGKASPLKKFQAAMQSDANRRYPWPSWFAPWSRVEANQKLSAPKK